MKRQAILYSFLAFILLTMTAMQCGKDYICQCEGGLTGKPEPMTVQATSQKNAESACDDFNTPAGTPDGYYNCRIQ